jgi:hypothetical protein
MGTGVPFAHPTFNYPTLLTVYLNSEISLNKQVEELLKENNYTKIIAKSSFESAFYKFGSDVVSAKQDHVAVYRLID